MRLHAPQSSRSSSFIARLAPGWPNGCRHPSREMCPCESGLRSSSRELVGMALDSKEVLSVMSRRGASGSSFSPRESLLALGVPGRSVSLSRRPALARLHPDSALRRSSGCSSSISPESLSRLATPRLRRRACSVTTDASTSFAGLIVQRTCHSIPRSRDRHAEDAPRRQGRVSRVRGALASVQRRAVSQALRHPPWHLTRPPLYLSVPCAP
jgi:hypothetical protein